MDGPYVPGNGNPVCAMTSLDVTWLDVGSIRCWSIKCVCTPPTICKMVTRWRHMYLHINQGFFHFIVPIHF